MQNKLIHLSILLATICLTSPLTSFAVENNPHKRYELTERHGPWMIMVATFSDIKDPSFRTDGMSAEDAADKLVRELRSKDIPAYVYAQGSKREKIETYDRLGNKDTRSYVAQNDMICVLAGNYDSYDASNAQDTLAKIKKFKPKFLADPKSGAVVRDAKDNKKGPFAGAFLTINPVRKPSDVVKKQVDQETKYFNSNIDYALISLKKRYTLRVATFTGKSAVPIGSSKFTGKEANFDKSIFDSSSYNLARAGEDAMQLTYAMRHKSPATYRAFGVDHFDAYVYHDKVQSYVTVGGFDSDKDPEIKRLAQLFMAKYKADEQTGEYALIAESLNLPGKDPKGAPVQTWAFDPVPELIEVPRLK